MKIRKTKKGFTIVELVIVIAVIGVLTAILVPTFISLTAKANKASDQSLVANLNTALKMQEAEDGAKNPTMHDAVLDLAEQGFDLGKLVTKSKEALLWNMETNQFELEKDQSGAKFWKIYDAAPASSTVSVYAKGNNFGTSVSVSGVGFDAGYVTSVATVNYTGGAAANDVVIRTNGGALTINDTNDASHQYHYGSSASVVVTTGNNCYEGHAVVAAMTVNAGKIIASDDSYIGLVQVAAGVTLQESTQGVFVIPANADATKIDATAAASVGYTIEGTTITPSAEKEAKSFYVINTADSLSDFVTRWNNGDEAIQLIKSVKFAADVEYDYTTTPWTPLGTWQHPFNGTIDGNGCSIKGMGIIENVAGQGTSGSTTGINGEAYGFIGIAGNGDLVVKNINFKDLSINHAGGNMVGAVVGFAPSNGKFLENASETWSGNAVVGTHNVTISNITVSGSIAGRQDVAGIAGKLYNSGKQTVSNCTVDATIVANETGTSGRAGGIVSMISNSQNALIENCVNKQSVTATKYVGGILGYASNSTILIKNCQNSGSLSGTQKGDIWNSKNKTGTPSVTIQ